MIHIIFDLESTCWEQDGDFQKENGEIIEIGAVKYRDNFKIDEFTQFIRPVKFPELSEFCKNLTSISQNDVDTAPLFKDAMSNFEKWIFAEADEDALMKFWSWGFYDKDQIIKECLLNGYTGKIAKLMVENHRNMKYAFGDATGIRKGRGMERALEYLNIPLVGTHHRGIDDARNIGKIFERIYSTLNL